MSLWQDYEIEVLIDNYGKVRLTDIAKYLGRSFSAASAKAKELNLRSPNKRLLDRDIWTESQDEILRKMYGKYPAKIIAKTIGRPLGSIYQRAYNFKLKAVVDGVYLKRRNIDFEKLAGQYVKGERSFCKICQDNHMGPNAMREQFLKLGVTIRTRTESNRVNMIKANAKVKELLETGEFNIRASAGQQGISLEQWSEFASTRERRLANTTAWRAWRIAVFRRDYFLCVLCGQRGIKSKKSLRWLEPHHIIQKRHRPDLMHDVDNGVTLCHPCHRSIRKHEREYEEKFKEYVLQRNAFFAAQAQYSQVELTV